MLRGPARRSVRGAVLLEAMVAILIFSIGILGIVGLQATAVKQSTDARYRVEAAQLADQLIGQMWAGNRTPASLQARFNTCSSSACPGFADWYATVANRLPGVSSTGITQPNVSVSDTGIVTITVFWLAPGEDDNATPHRYDVEAQIAQ
ncbi:MAG: hypothetical protein EOO24_53675 [Comamonadaceae bacterium]|nr:MAG: hypothetical protein EOO24_53675 [Comamonadaceae bacterium]